MARQFGWKWDKHVLRGMIIGITGILDGLIMLLSFGQAYSSFGLAYLFYDAKKVCSRLIKKQGAK